MNLLSPEASTGVADWNVELAEKLLADANSLRLRMAVDKHIEIVPQASDCESFTDFLKHTHDVYLERGDYKEAHGYGVLLYQIDRQDLGAPLVYESGYLLAQGELAKATKALKEGDYRRAGDKAVWAATHFGDAMRAGRIDAQDEFYAAAGVAIEANASYGADPDNIEKPIFDDCDELGVPRPIEVVVAARLRAYEQASCGGELAYKGLEMFRAAKALEKLGVPVPSLTRHAAVRGIKLYLEGANTFYPGEYIEALEKQGFPKEGLGTIRLTVAHQQYKMDYWSASHADDRDIASWGWARVARDCVELIKLGDEEVKDNLRAALENQIAWLDVEYFSRHKEQGMDVHFDHYVETGIISDEESATLKQALKRRLESIREQYLEQSKDQEDWLRREVLERIDKTIAEFTLVRPRQVL